MSVLGKAVDGSFQDLMSWEDMQGNTQVLGLIHAINVKEHLQDLIIWLFISKDI